VFREQSHKIECAPPQFTRCRSAATLIRLGVPGAAPAGGRRTTLGLYNILNTRAPAARFWYVDRLHNEIAAYPDGRADIHEYPLEPFMVRFTIMKNFDTP
jgi:hypothetical protein